MPNPGPVETVDAIQGTSFVVVESAMGPFERHKLDLAQYKILVMRQDDATLVAFTDKDGNPASRRSIGVREGSGEELSPKLLEALLSDKDKKVLDAIQGAHFAAIKAAVKVFRRRIPNLAPYKIEVVREGSSLVVIFTDKEGNSDDRGNPGTRPGFEVEIDSRDMSVLRSNFVR
jgi:hypothetical protein